MRRALALFAILAFACTAPVTTGVATATPTALTSATATPVPTPALSIDVTEAAYGQLALSTRPGARCDVVIDMQPGQLGDRPPERTSESVGEGGRLVWSYAAPPQPTQRAAYSITCSAGAERATSTVAFQIAAREPRAAAFTARVVAADPPTETRIDPTLVPLRDAVLARIRTDLAREWAAATRGLGSVRVVDEPADILVKVIAARHESQHLRQAADRSQEIRIYVADEQGPETPENLVAVTLHELGHIWCCSGDGTEPGGHWAAAVADPELQGVDRFGLMNHPVSCVIFSSAVSCPNRFSRRELTTIGFTNIPAPPADPCLSQARPLEARIAQLDGTIATKRAATDTTEASLNAISTRLRAIEAQYGRTLPPGVYEEYNGLVDRYNALLVPYRRDLAEHNAAVSERNALVTNRAALPC